VDEDVLDFIFEELDPTDNVDTLADACGDDYQVKRIESRWFLAPGSVSPGA